jgi:hypothetical protein
MNAAQAFLAFVFISLLNPNVKAETAQTTKYPVIYVHGLLGFDSLAGFNYFGNDLGVFVGDSCQFLELNGCNGWISGAQTKNAFRAQVTPLQDSEVRGQQLYEQTRNIMATTGSPIVNYIGHSQGSLDMRKSATMLRAQYGSNRAGAMISISGPHRGSPHAKTALDRIARDSNGVFCKSSGNPALACANALNKLVEGTYNLISASGFSNNDAVWSLAQFVYEDYDPNDGRVTGAKAFNVKYPGTGVSGYNASIVTAQESGVSPILGALHLITGQTNIDGDGNGNAFDIDDDGLVGVGSQQYGVRLQYNPNDWKCNFLVICWDPLDTVSEITTLGNVTNPNSVNDTQRTSRAGVMNQDHLDIVGFGPDTLDENEFYAALMNQVAKKGF